MTKAVLEEPAVQLVELSRVVDNWFNINSIKPDADSALGADMKAHGPSSIDPVHLVPLINIKPGSDPKQLLVLDGMQRVRWARTLKWESLRAYVHYEVLDEASARVFMHRKVQERGSIDPFKQGEHFAWLQSQGWTQEKIAKENNVDQGTVSKRIGLVKLPEQVRALSKNTAKLPASSAEALIGIPEKDAVEVAKKAVSWDWTTRQVEEAAKRVKEEIAEKKKVQELVQTPKAITKRCPTCKGEPVAEGWSSNANSVMCSNHDVWDVTVDYAKKAEEEKKKEAGNASHAKKGPEQYVRTPHTVEQFLLACSEKTKDFFPRFDRITSATIRGVDKDGNALDIEMGKTWRGYDEGEIKFTVGKDHSSLTLEKKSYGAGHLKDFKALVRGGYIRSDKDLVELDKRFNEFFDEYFPGGNGKAKKQDTPTKKTTALSHTKAEVEEALRKLEEECPLEEAS